MQVAGRPGGKGVAFLVTLSGLKTLLRVVVGGGPFRVQRQPSSRISTPATIYLCDPRQVPSPLCALMSPFMAVRLLLLTYFW